jgi:hypothetical protein
MQRCIVSFGATYVLDSAFTTQEYDFYVAVKITTV